MSDLVATLQETRTKWISERKEWVDGWGDEWVCMGTIIMYQVNDRDLFFDWFNETSDEHENSEKEGQCQRNDQRN
jgi:hypothetical protein